MEQFEIYNDINTRTGGDIYLGIVGPVRTGKSTFITKFMENLVLPEIKNKEDRVRAVDELPQSAVGKTIMTTEPKFVPNEAVKIMLSNNIEAKFRLVDCVGYLIDGVNGATEDGAPRLVKTPWSEELMPFNMAAEIGTKKVITEHSTIALLITTDGSFSGIDRTAYAEAEERVVNELKGAGKPFVVVLNSSNPQSSECEALKQELMEKYDAPVLAVDVQNMDKDVIADIMEAVLYEFPITKINIDIPKWVRALDYNNSLIQEIASTLQNNMSGVAKMRDAQKLLNIFNESDAVEGLRVVSYKLENGVVDLFINVSNSVFYKMLSEQCGIDINDEFCLMSSMKEFADAKKEFDKIKEAFIKAKNDGYGIVVPQSEELTLEAPQIVKKGSGSGVKLKASAPSYHIMRVDVETEVSPAVGISEQSETFSKYLMGEIENNPEGIWNTNMFGKPLSSFVEDGIYTKLSNVPEEAQVKMRKTMTKIVNEGKGGIICILL